MSSPNNSAVFYTVDDLPVFQNRMFRTEAEARSCVKGTVQLVQDLDTGLISNRAFNPALMEYDSDYQNEQAVSVTFRRHLEDVAAIVKRQLGGCSLIEVGCGKGHFLELLQSRGFEITGLDPTYEGTNPSVIPEYFTSKVGLKADGVVLRHVLEHVQDPVGFLSGISQANGGVGKAYIEVPCFDWICEHRAWFDVFYEHVNYFRLADFSRLFGTIYDAGRIFGGQYLYVVVDLASLRAPRYADEPFAFPTDFLASVERHAARLRGRLSGSSAIWGGAAKGVIFALLLQRAGAAIDLVIDINPAKQGKYLPATGLRVHSPDEGERLLVPNADIVVMNGNYLSEIKQATGSRFTYVTVDDG